MQEVNRNALIGLIRLMLVLPVLVFLPAWTLRYWQAWTCLGVFFLCAILITADLMKTNPDLLARRMKAGPRAEAQKSQKVIQALAAAAFVAIFVVSALDHRFGWSRVFVAVEIVGDALIIAGFAFVHWVFKANSFTSGVIEVAADQQVITTGPYAIVRHPMYLGSLIMLLGIPLGLGSWWGLWTIVSIAAVIVLRLLDEEKFLARNLAGYSDYTRKTPNRLIPLIW